MDFIYERTPRVQEGGECSGTTEVRFGVDEFEKRKSLEKNLPNYEAQFAVREVTPQGIVFDTIIHRRIIHRIIRNEPIEQESLSGVVTTSVYPQLIEPVDGSKYL